MHTCIHAYMHTCMHAYMHAYTDIHRHTQTSIHPSIDRSIHTYIRTYVHTYILIIMSYCFFTFTFSFAFYFWEFRAECSDRWWPHAMQYEVGEFLGKRHDFNGQVRKARASIPVMSRCLTTVDKCTVCTVGYCWWILGGHTFARREKVWNPDLNVLFLRSHAKQRCWCAVLWFLSKESSS